MIYDLPCFESVREKKEEPLSFEVYTIAIGDCQKSRKPMKNKEIAG